MPIVSEIKRTYSGLTPFTRTWLNIAFGLAVGQFVVSILFFGYANDLCAFNLRLIGHLQLWRLITCFIYIGSSIYFVINALFLATIVDTVERAMERQDFIAFLAFSCVTLFGITVVYDLQYVSFPLLMTFMVQYAAIDPYELKPMWLGCGTISLYRYATPLPAFFLFALSGNLESYFLGVLVGLVWIAIVRYLPSYESIDQPMREMVSDVEQPATYVSSNYQAASSNLSVAPSPSAPVMQQSTQSINLV